MPCGGNIPGVGTEQGSSVVGVEKCERNQMESDAVGGAALTGPCV